MIRWFRRADPDDDLEEEHAEVVLPEQIDFGEPVEPVQEIRQLPEVPEYAVIVATAATRGWHMAAVVTELDRSRFLFARHHGAMAFCRGTTGAQQPDQRQVARPRTTVPHRQHAGTQADRQLGLGKTGSLLFAAPLLCETHADAVDQGHRAADRAPDAEGIRLAEPPDRGAGEEQHHCVGCARRRKAGITACEIHLNCSCMMESGVPIGVDRLMCSSPG